MYKGPEAGEQTEISRDQAGRQRDWKETWSVCHQICIVSVLFVFGANNGMKTSKRDEKWVFEEVATTSQMRDKGGLD